MPKGYATHKGLASNLDELGKQGLAMNKYKDDEKAKQEKIELAVDPADNVKSLVRLTADQQKEITLWTAGILNDIRKQLGFSNRIVVTNKSLEFAKYIADNSTIAGLEHDDKALQDVSKNVLQIRIQSESIGFGGAQATMNDLQESVYYLMLQMLFDDADSNWGHAMQISGMDFDQMKDEYFGIGIRPQNNIIGFETFYPEDPAKADEGGRLTIPSVDTTELQAELTTAQSDLNTKSNALTSAKSANDEAQSALTTANNNLVTAQTNLTNAQKAKTQADSDLETAKTQLTTDEAKLASAQEAVQALSADLATKQANLQSAKDVLEESKKSLASAESDLTAKQNALTEAENELKSAQATLNSAKQAVKDAQAKVDSLKAKLDSLTNAEPNYEAAKTAYDKAVSDLETAQNNLKSAENVNDEAQAKLDSAKSELAKAQAVLDKILEKERAEEALKKAEEEAKEAAVKRAQATHFYQTGSKLFDAQGKEVTGYVVKDNQVYDAKGNLVGVVSKKVMTRELHRALVKANTLPQTGNESTVLAGLGVALIGLGSMLGVAKRKRQ